MFHSMTNELPEQKDYKEFIQTSDTMLASALYCSGFDIMGIDKHNRKRVIFFYNRTSQIEIVVRDYFAHRLRIDPLELDRAQRELMAQIHTE